MEKWIHSSKNTGSGNDSIVITVDSNKQSDINTPSVQRIAAIRVATPEVIKECIIKQKGDMVLIEFENFHYDSTGENFTASAILVDGQRFEITNQNSVLVCPEILEIQTLIQDKQVYITASEMGNYYQGVTLGIGGSRVTMYIVFCVDALFTTPKLKTMSISSRY